MGLIRIASFSNRLEAGLAAGVLESRGVRHVVRGDDVGIFGPGHMGQSAIGIDLLVPEDQAPEARQALQDAGFLAED